MPGVDFRWLRERIAMQDVLQLLQFEPTFRRGDQWRGPCPVHGSRNPRSRSFSVNVRLGRYHCFRLRIAGARVGTVGGGARRQPVCRGAGVVPTVGTGDTMGDALVAEAGQETTHR